MYNIKLSGLDTGQVYYVKVRAKVFGYETSEWTLPYRFETPVDTMAPGKVETLAFISEGDSFIASWTAPPFNEDGSPCGDIAYYKLVIEDLDRNIEVVARSIDTVFTLDPNRNKQLFGLLAGKLKVTVSAVDITGNEGQTSEAIAHNPPPAKVKNVSTSVSVETVALTWDESEETDLMNYEVHVGSEPDYIPDETTIRAKVAAGANSFTHETTSLSLLHYKIIAVDKFNQKSIPSDVVSAQPRLTTDYDKEPPAPVQGFSVEQVLSDDNSSAIARIAFTENTEDDLDKYEVQYRLTGETGIPWSFANIPSDEASAEIKPLPLSTDYDFRIRAVDIYSNKSEWSDVIVAEGVKKEGVPDAPLTVTMHGGLTNLMITWDPSTDPSMENWAGNYEVHVDTTLGFEDPIVINTSGTITSLTNLEKDTVYYARVRAIDPYGNIGPWSAAASDNTGSVNETASRTVFSLADAHGLSMDGVPFVNGDVWYKKDSSESIVGMWEFFDGEWIIKQVKNLADDAVTSDTIAADAVLAGHIKAQEIVGDHLKADTALVNSLKIRSTLTIDAANGSIRSSNYNYANKTGFYMDQQQIIINQGQIQNAAIVNISGEKITTGSITSNQTTNTGNGAIAKWSINKEGGATFGDVTVNGRMIVGGYTSSGQKANTSIQSDGYDSGKSGWAIKGNGDVEFNNGTFRGTLSLEKAGVNDVNLSMKASVSPIDVYVTPEKHLSIDTANIRGRTYSYDRNDNDGDGIYLPSVADTTRPANFFIGPTTERALNIQVHDGQQENRVYLSRPVKNTTLTMFNIGEQTDSSTESSFRENQGVRFGTYRNESRGYVYGGTSSAGNENITENRYSAITVEKSPMIPESFIGGGEYPESKHELTSTTVYEAPLKKNLIHDGMARGMAVLTGPGSSGYGVMYAQKEAPWASQSGIGQYSIVFTSYGTGYGTGIDTFNFGNIVIPTTGRYILSMYVNTENTDAPVHIGAQAAGTWMTANDPLTSNASGISSSLNYAYTKVEPGVRSQRISFYISNLSAGTRQFYLRPLMVENEFFEVAKIQLEFAAYANDTNLPDRVRNSNQPTPWTANGTKISSAANFRLITHPFVDGQDHANAATIRPKTYSQINKDDEVLYPTEAVLSFDTKYESPYGPDVSQSSAEFKFSPHGVTYPGNNVPYLPTAVTINYNYVSDFAVEDRPRPGGSSSGATFQLTGRSEWPIAPNPPVIIQESWSTAIQSTWSFRYPGWVTVNQNSLLRTIDSFVGAQQPANSDTQRANMFMYNTRPMMTTDQSSSVFMNPWYINFGTQYRQPMGGPAININPSTGARIVAYYNSITSNYGIYRYTSHTARTTLATGNLGFGAQHKFTLGISRLNNTIKLLVNGQTVRTITVASGSLPAENSVEDSYVGLCPANGLFGAYDARPTSVPTALAGSVSPTSVNINNGRGLNVDSTGLIRVDAPGYYHISVHLEPDGRFGGSRSHHFQMYVLSEYQDSGPPGIQLNSDHAQQEGILRLVGSGVGYLEGNTRIYIWTNDPGRPTINKADVTVVRIA